ncbi:MAG: hypothetical protein OXH96_16985 [Spirochaetaceae bacterium]|nr:hypothetical protein [Spirochaetaceae bacterium]
MATLSDRQSENIRFWFEVFNGLDLPCRVRIDKGLAEPLVWLPAPGTSHGGYGLPFAAYYRSPDDRKIGCYVRPREGDDVARRIFGALGEPPVMKSWDEGGERRSLGYECEIGVMPGHGEDETPEFREAVRWMRYHLDKLVRTLYPRISEMLSQDET